MHYICTGTCKGVSDKPGVCQDPSCPKHQHPLEACDCADGKHEGHQAQGASNAPEKHE